MKTRRWNLLSCGVALGLTAFWLTAAALPAMSTMSSDESLGGGAGGGWHASYSMDAAENEAEERALDAGEDTTSLTDDHSVAVPTGWWLYTNVSEATINSLTQQLGARITDIEIHSFVGSAPRFTVRMVKNTGAYAVSGWWWYYGQTLTQVGQRLSTHKGRLIDIEPYRHGGTIRYAVILVSNTGSAARAWSYFSGITSAQITTHLNTTGDRLIDLDTYFVGSTKRYSAISIANTGGDSKSWQWWLNQSTAGVSSKVAAFNGRIVDLDRQPDGTYNVIQVKNSGGDAFGWW